MPLSLADVLAAQGGAPGPTYEGGPNANVTPGGVLAALGLGGPSWLEAAQKQTSADIAAYQRGGVPELMADTGQTQELAGGFGGTTIGKPRFVHGTTAENLPSIRQYGLLPGTSPYTQKFYGNDIPETLFLSGDENVKKAFSSIRGQIGQKLNKHPGDVTAQDIREHGGLVTTRDEGGYDVYQHDPEGTAQNLRGGYTDNPPPQSEPGDWLRNDSINTVSGRQLYEELARNKGNDLGSYSRISPKAASDALQEAGIPGIRYLDQGSRNVQGGRIEPTKHGTFALYDSDNAKFNEFANRADAEAALRGSSNYVVFNPEIVDILKKYGLAGLTMGGVLTAAGQEPAPSQ